MTNPSLDAYQQIFGLACLADRTADYTGSSKELQEQLQYDFSFYFNNVPPVETMNQQNPSTADPSIPPLLGSWNLVWGPALIEELDQNGFPTGVADNALYVVQCDAVDFPGGPTLPTYAVAIAATNPASLYDWETEDFAVSEVVNWTTYDPSNFTTSDYNGIDPYISKGTATGVSILLKLTSPGSAASPNTTLQQFLESLAPDPETAIIFCGHSLAGALSPTLALYLKEKKQLDAFGITLVYPTAGPTPGDIAFANLFNNTFPPLPPNWTKQTGNYQSWNTMHWNDLDVVPHAWAEADLQLIHKIYGKATKLSTRITLEILQDIAIADALKPKVTYTRIQNQSLPGVLQHSDESPGSINVPPQSLEDYLRQLRVQHVYMYYGMPDTNGLILSQPLPPSPANTVPGIALVKESEMIAKIIEQIIGWISAHALSEKKQATKVEADE